MSTSGSSDPPVAFILGYGENIGSGVAQKFKSKGFQVAVASRKLNPDDLKAEGYLGINLDLSHPEALAAAFAEVEKEYGLPSLVVYNAASTTFAPGGPADPLSIPYANFERNVQVSGLTAFEAARLAKAGFDKLGSGVFIATGNVLPWTSMPCFVGLSAGKRVLANIIESCAESYGPSGKRFYFASEVSRHGGPQIPPDGPTHGLVFYKLWRQPAQGPWDLRFVKGGSLFTGGSPTKRNTDINPDD